MTAPAEGEKSEWPYRATDDVVVSLTYVRKASRTAQDFADELNKAFAAGEKKGRERASPNKNRSEKSEIELLEEAIMWKKEVEQRK